MRSAESGTNWKVIRKFIPNQLAETAGIQALLISGVRSDFIRDFTRAEGALDNQDLSVIRVDVPKLRAHPVAEHFSALLEVYELTEEEVSNGLDEFFVNQYGPRGATVPHKDSYKDARATLAVGLGGLASARIQDPASGKLHIIELHPRDALYLDNSVPEDEKPLHELRNLLPVPRTALVNG